MSYPANRMGFFTTEQRPPNGGAYAAGGFSKLE